MDRCNALQKHFPRLWYFIERDSNDFRTLTFTLGNSGGYLLILKRFGDDGSPEVLFHHAHTLVDCFLGVEHALTNGRWKPDKFKQ